MPCLKLPTLPFPTLPTGIGITIPGLQFQPKLGLCCQLPLPGINVPPVPLGVAIPPQIVLAVKAAKAAIKAYLAKIPLDCPRQVQAALNNAVPQGVQ